MPVNVTPLGGQKLKVSGSIAVKMSSFKLEPVSLTVAGVGLKAGDEVKLFFEWIMAQRAAAKQEEHSAAQRPAAP